jgi:hypothetical protein
VFDKEEVRLEVNPMSERGDRGSDDTPTTAALIDRTEEGRQNGLTNPDPLEDRVSEDLNYAPVPPRRSFTVRVTCRMLGRGQPLPFPEDDE